MKCGEWSEEEGKWREVRCEREGSIRSVYVLF